jgi:hypothetical protein
VEVMETTRGPVDLLLEEPVSFAAIQALVSARHRCFDAGANPTSSPSANNWMSASMTSASGFRVKARKRAASAPRRSSLVGDRRL